MRHRTQRLATIANNTQFCSTAQDRFMGLTGNNLTAQNVNFTQNTFYREFSDAPAITAATQPASLSGRQHRPRAANGDRCLGQHQQLGRCQGPQPGVNSAARLFSMAAEAGYSGGGVQAGFGQAC